MLKLHPRDMARKMGISEGVYRSYEVGEQAPGSDKLSALLEYVQDVSSKWLLTGSGRIFKSLERSEFKEKILDIVASNPSVERIVLMLQGIEDEDLNNILISCEREEEDKGSPN